MSAKRKLFVYAYDIADDRVRNRVARLLEDGAAQVQGSVFEGFLTKTDANKLFDRLERVILPGDSLRMYCITSDGSGYCRQFGGAPLMEAESFWLL